MRVALQILLVVALASGGTASAQDSTTFPPRRPGFQYAPIGNFRGLWLTDAQVAAVVPITLAYLKRTAAFEVEYDRPGTDLKELAVRQLAARAKHLADLRALLTTEQQIVFDRNANETKLQAEGVFKAEDRRQENQRSHTPDEA